MPPRRCFSTKDDCLRAVDALRAGSTVGIFTDMENDMIAVIFESWPAPGKMQSYLDMGARLGPQLEKIDGFISIERFQSFSDPGKLLALSIWRDEAAVDAFRNWDVHRNVQSNSRKDVFLDYRLRVAAVLRDYGMTERAQAPDDSRAAHV